MDKDYIRELEMQEFLESMTNALCELMTNEDTDPIQDDLLEYLSVCKARVYWLIHNDD